MKVCHSQTSGCCSPPPLSTPLEADIATLKRQPPYSQPYFEFLRRAARKHHEETDQLPDMLRDKGFRTLDGRSVGLSVCLSVCLSVGLSACLSVCLSSSSSTGERKTTQAVVTSSLGWRAPLLYAAHTVIPPSYHTQVFKQHGERKTQALRTWEVHALS